MKKFSILILLIFSSHLSAQTNYKSILYLKAESKQLIENSHFLSDSINTNNILTNKHSVGNIVVQTIVGTGFGWGAGILTIGAAWSYSWDHKETDFGRAAFLILLPTTMILGSAIGVYLPSKYENKKHSFWQTLKYSAYGAGGGIVLGLIMGSLQESLNGGEVLFISLTPVMGALYYSNFIAEWPETNNKNLKEVSFRKMNYSFKDYYDSEQLFRVNILSISF